MRPPRSTNRSDYAAWKAADGRLDTHWIDTYSGAFPNHPQTCAARASSAATNALAS